MALNQLQLKVKGDDGPIWQGVFEDREAALIVKEFMTSQRNGWGAGFPLGPESELIVGAAIARNCTLVSMQMPEPQAQGEDPRIQELQKRVAELEEVVQGYRIVGRNDAENSAPIDAGVWQDS
jgi:hypothetical protein